MMRSIGYVISEIKRKKRVFAKPIFMACRPPKHIFPEVINMIDMTYFVPGRIFCFLFVWTIEYVVRSFLPEGVFFHLVTTGWIFDISF